MQPNGQYPPPISSPNIPEYLHMEPIPDPVAEGRNRKRKIYKLVLILFAILIAMSVGVFFYWYLVYNSPQEKLHRVLEKNMQVSYVEWNKDVSKKGGSIKMAASTDVSDTMHAKSDIRIDTSGTNKTGSSVQTIVLDDKRYMFLIKSASQGTFPEDLKKDQWYSAPFHATDRKDVGYWIDDPGSPLVLNSVQGIIPTGNFTSSQRSQLLDFIQLHDIYHILSIQTQTDNGTRLTGYDIQLDINKINALNAQIVKILGLAQLFTIQKPYPTYQEATLWVDETTGRFSKITYNSGKSKDDIDTKQVTTLTYPSKLSIMAPSSVKELSP